MARRYVPEAADRNQIPIHQNPTAAFRGFVYPFAPDPGFLKREGSKAISGAVSFVPEHYPQLPQNFTAI
jgi:hypothetical protein